MKCTGLKDRNGQDIYENEIILAGMRVGDPHGWKEERVVNIRKGWRRFILKPIYMLADPVHGEITDMQNNPLLRQKLSHI